MAERTHEERVAAVEAMFRVRSVESPPNPAGHRTVWHRGRRGAELVSELDAEGQVTWQELRLHDEVLVWVGGVFRTGAGAAAQTSWDEAPSKERLERIAKALTSYRGTDKLIGHVRDVLGVKDPVEPPAKRPQRRAPVAPVQEAQRREALRESARRRSLGTLGLIAGALVTALGLLMLWRSLGS
jgi:hypothetical protein